MKLNVACCRIWVCRKISTTPMNETSTVSFWRPMKSFSSGGMTRRTACGSDDVAHGLQLAETERARGRGLARMDRVDPGAVDLRHVGGVQQRERDDAPEERVARHARQPQAGNAEAEHEDDQEAGKGAEQVDVDRRQQPHGEEDRAGQAAQHGEHEPEEQDQHLGDEEEGDVDPELADDAGRGLARSSRRRGTHSLTRSQPGALTTTSAEHGEEHRPSRSAAISRSDRRACAP